MTFAAFILIGLAAVGLGAGGVFWLMSKLFPFNGIEQ